MSYIINKNIIVSFLDYYGLEDIRSEPISDGLSSSVSLITCENRKYVLKIYPKNSNIETEVQFGNYLFDKGIPTAKVIKNSKGQLITVVDDLRGVLFKFCSGEQIKWDNISSAFSEHVAEILAKMHILMLNNNASIPAKEQCGCEIYSTTGLSNTKIIQKKEEIENSVKNLVLSDIRKGLIHADLTRRNVLATKDKNDVDAIIDCGDAHYDYIVWDLSILITHIFITKTYGIDWRALSSFIKKYYSLFPLTEKEIDVIIPFIKIRNLNLAIEVNRLALDKKKENMEELLSIENSVMTKLKLVEENQERLVKLLKDGLRR